MFGILYSFLFVVWVMVMNTRIQAGPPVVADLVKEDEKFAPVAKKGVGQFMATVGNILQRGPASLSETWRGPAPTEESKKVESKKEDKDKNSKEEDKP